MAAGWTTLTIKDGGGTTRTMRVWAEDTSSGPYSFGQVLGDGSGAASLAKAEDAAHVSGDMGIMALGVRKDTAVALGADGDYHPPIFDSTGKLWVNASVSSGSTSGDVAHDGVDSGNPVKVGGKSIAHGTNPTAVAAADRTDWYFNRAGVPFVIGGHPNVVSRAHLVADSDGAQTDAALLTVGSGVKIVITRMTVVCDNSNSADCRVIVGFGTANVPSNALAGVNGVIVDGSFDGGAGVTIGDGSGIIGVGADNEDLRLTCSDPVAGNIRISYSYYTIES